MKPWLWFALGAFVLFAGELLFVIYRAFTVKPSLSPRTSLAQAVFDGNTEQVKTLLTKGADANTTMNETYQIASDGSVNASFKVPILGAAPQQAGMPLLGCAAMLGSTDIIKLLLDHGAEVNSKDTYGQTPLILAAWQGDAEDVKLLLDKHADVTLRDAAGKTALMWAQTENHKSVQEILKKAGAKE
jgi:ankyrin repeat protein